MKTLKHTMKEGGYAQESHFRFFSVVRSQDLPWMINEQTHHANQGLFFVASVWLLSPGVVDIFIC